MFTITNKDRLHFKETRENLYKKFYIDSDKQENTFLRIPTKIMNDRELNSNDRIVLSKIVELSQQKGYCFASNARLANYLGLSTRTTTNVIKRLYNLKYIDRTSSFSDGNIATKKRRIYVNDIILRVYKETTNKKTSTDSDPFKVASVDAKLPF